ncbi:MAG: PSD1 and planctomycete cytochrome C domain-containing protein [Lentisphaerales bacterium]|nr:PSD1 and planctomycete cytochrome C domain-containing protein [Lentisphaerales bacterium]
MRFTVSIFVIFSLLSSLSGNEGFAFFEKKIRPALKTHCYRCHSDEENRIKGGLLVDTKMGLLQGGDSGAAIVPGNLEKSILWKSITYKNDMEMPPKKPMSDQEIADFKKWILMGAPDPRERKNILVKTKVTEEDIEKGKEFWSYKKVEYTPPDRPTNADWSKSKVDAYIYEGLQKQQLKPAGEADATTIIKRLYSDLIGLLPTPDEVRRFTVDYRQDKNGAMLKTVNKLLASHHFGERWGRHWLDVARYAESTGNGVNAPYPHAWRYRDYVIESFNTDKPYDRFIQEQLAGDLLKAKTDEEWTNNIIATGFLALGPRNLADQDRRQFEADLIDEQIDVVSRGILGISVACARCHDHKFEPIPQSDYYALAGIFQSTKTYYGTLKSRQNRHGTSLIKMPVKDLTGADTKISMQELAGLKESLAKAEADLRELRMSLRQKKNNGGLDNNSQRQAIVAEQRVVKLQSEVKSYDDNGVKHSFCMGVQKVAPVNARIFERGEVSKPGQEISRGTIRVMCDESFKVSSSSTGRKELAEWITNEEHPLTARVMVNRVWAKLMGEGIVSSLGNFGATGQAPTHPGLLDYLSITFVNNNWSVKSLIKKIVMTKTYRMASTMNEVNFKKDPDNKYLWRLTPRRLDAEVIRDSVLQLSGKLEDGPRYSSLLAEKAANETRVRVRGDNPFDGNSNYRSVYLPIVRDMLPSMLKTFDFTESMLTTGTREQNNTAAQALFMMNNKFILAHSDNMAERIISKNSTTDMRIKEAFIMAYSRIPQSHELSAARNLHDSFRRSKDLAKKKTTTKDFVALSAVCQALLASAEFRYRN